MSYSFDGFVIKDCPHCGSPAEVNHETSNGWWIECRACGHSTAKYHTLADAAITWGGITGAATTKADPVKEPNHYKTHDMECIDEMLLLFGRTAVKSFCLCNAWKYRYRADAKTALKTLKSQIGIFRCTRHFALLQSLVCVNYWVKNNEKREHLLGLLTLTS